MTDMKLKVGMDAVFDAGSSYACKNPYYELTRRLSRHEGNGSEGENGIVFVVRSFNSNAPMSRRSPTSGVSRVTFGRDGVVAIFIEIGEDIWHSGPAAVSGFLPTAALTGLDRFEKAALTKNYEYDPTSLEQIRADIRGMIDVPRE